MQECGSCLFVLAEGQKLAVIYTDGQRLRENGTLVSSAMKYTEITPISAENGQFIFDICGEKGDNQFVPQYDSSYIVTVWALDQEGNLLAECASKAGSVKCAVVPIYEKLEIAPPYANPNNYVQIDLGEAKNVNVLDITVLQTNSKRTKKEMSTEMAREMKRISTNC